MADTIKRLGMALGMALGMPFMRRNVGSGGTPQNVDNVTFEGTNVTFESEQVTYN